MEQLLLRASAWCRGDPHVGVGQCQDAFELQPGVTNSYVVSGGRCRWLPGGKQIAYLDKNELGAWGVYVQDFIPGQNTFSSRKPIAGFDLDSPTESFGISPDGSRVTICQREQSSSLVLAEHPPLD